MAAIDRNPTFLFRHPGLDPGSMLRQRLWIPDQARDDEAVGSQVSLRPVADIESRIKLVP